MAKSKEAKTYTQKEVSEALNKLTIEETALLLIRKKVNKKLAKKRRNIKFYKELDIRQYKAF